MPGVTPNFIETAGKIQAFSISAKYALIYGFIAVVISIPVSALIAWSTGFPLEMTWPTLAIFAFSMTVSVLMYYGEGGPKVRRIDSVVVKLDEEIASLDEDMQRLKRLEGVDNQLRVLARALEEKTLKRQKYMAMRTTIMERKNNIVELEEELDQLELHDVPPPPRRSAKTKMKARRK